MIAGEPHPERMSLTDRDRRLIAFVFRLRLLTRDQAMALAPFGSLTRANTRLAALVFTRLLSRKLLPVYPGKGSAQALYYLGRESIAVLEADFQSVQSQIRQVSRWDSRQIEHVIAANQALVDALVALGQDLRRTLISFRTEPELRQIFSDRPLVPDGWFSWAELGKRFNCFVEIDLHHEGLHEWRAKVLRYQEYAESGLHGERFGFSSFRVLVLAKSAARLKNLRPIALEAGHLFLFGSNGQIGAGNFFDLAWQTAGGDTLVRLAEA